MSIKVTGLTIYPVKGLKGIELNETVLTPNGLHYDRRWMVVMPNGCMVTQRQMPHMALLGTCLRDGALVLSRQGIDDIEIPLDQVQDGLVDVSIWNDKFSATEEGGDVSFWLTEALACKFPLRLVRMAPDVTRPQSNPELSGHSAHFADAAPYLIANEASLSALKEQLAQKGEPAVPMNRFRPNIVFKGLSAFKEYEGESLREQNGRYELGLLYPSQRCVVTTTDQETGIVDKKKQEPLSTLKQMQTAPGYEGAYFGENAVLLKGEGETISVGDQWCPLYD